MYGNYFFVSYIVLAIVYELFWYQIHCTVVFAQLVCSFNPSGIFGLNSSISIHIIQIFSSLTLFGVGRGRKISASTETFHNFLTRNDENVKLGDI